MNKGKDKIRKENYVRIYDKELIDKLNVHYQKVQYFVSISRNEFITSILRIGIDYIRSKRELSFLDKIEYMLLSRIDYRRIKRKQKLYEQFNKIYKIDSILNK